MITLVKNTIRVLSPRSIYAAGRYCYQRYRRWRYNRIPKLSEKDFRSILTECLGVRPGSVLFVHSSVDGMHLGFSFLRVLSILQDAVGKEGTLLFPCNYYSGRAEDALRNGEVFDVRNTVTNMGIIPELARRQPGACRSLHPTNSVVALGKHAKELTETHHLSVYPCGDQSPYYKILDYDSQIIGLGVTTASLSFFHAIEDVMQDEFPIQTRTEELFDGIVIDWNGQKQVIKTLAASKNIGRRNVPKYIHRHIPKNVACDLRINGVNYFTAKAAELAEKTTALARQGITIYTYH